MDSSTSSKCSRKVIFYIIAGVIAAIFAAIIISLHLRNNFFYSSGSSGSYMLPYNVYKCAQDSLEIGIPSQMINSTLCARHFNATFDLGSFDYYSPFWKVSCGFQLDAQALLYPMLPFHKIRDDLVASNETLSCTYHQTKMYRDPYAPVDGRPLFSDQFSHQAVVAPLKFISSSLIDASQFNLFSAQQPAEPVLSSSASTPEYAMDESARRALANKWHESAKFEHASVASFSKFSLQLMAAGAPFYLIQQAHLAAIQELNHAKLCLQIAALIRPCDRAVQFGGLPLSSIQIESGLAELALETSVEAATNELFAAFQAALARQHVTDGGPIGHTLEVIMKEETEHAALAWNTLRWTLDEAARRADDGAEMQRVVRAIERGLLQGSDSTVPDVHGYADDDDLLVQRLSSTSYDSTTSDFPLGFGHIHQHQAVSVILLVRRDIIHPTRNWLFQSRFSNDKDERPDTFQLDTDMLLHQAGGHHTKAVADYFVCLIQLTKGTANSACHWRTTLPVAQAFDGGYNDTWDTESS